MVVGKKLSCCINMEIKAILIIIAALALLFIITPANAELEIVLDKISPQPLEPGHDLLLSVRLSNEYSDIDDVKLAIVPDSPILLKNDNDRIINIGRIIKYGAVTENYLLHIDPGAVSGAYEIELRARWLSNGQQREANKTFKVMVRGVPQLAISNITISPERINPQDAFNLGFSISNEGTGIAREARISVSTSGLPFVPAGADAKVIKKLNPGEYDRLNYKILVKDKAEISSYSIPIKMEYKDENGENSSLQSFVGIRVLGKAKLSIADIKIEPQIPVKGDLVTMNMRIENSGNGDARSVKVSLNMPFEGTRTAFLGKIKPNDDAPAVFAFYATEGGDIPYSSAIEFEDDLGMHTATEALNLNVHKTNRSSSISPVSVMVVVIGASIFYLYRRKK